MKSLLLALALLSTSALADNKWTVHTASVHVGVIGLNNINPGLAYNVTDNVRVGALYNSYRLPSLYAARLFPLHDRVRVGVGVITGYTLTSWDEGLITGKASGVIPLVAVEVDVTDNVSLLWFGQAINLEVRF